jgi:hypothetical protein
MQNSLVNALRAERCWIGQRWRDLLRREPVASPLSHPDALVHLIDGTLDEVFSALTRPGFESAPFRSSFEYLDDTHCPCGRNPLLSYFVAAEHVLHEALELARASVAQPGNADAAFAELNAALRRIAARDIQAFCGVCMYRLVSPVDARGGRPRRQSPRQSDSTSTAAPEAASAAPA